MRTANTHKNMARCAATATLACVLGLGLVAPAYADTASDLAAARTKLEQIGTQTQQIYDELATQTQALDQTAGEITQKQQEIADGQTKLSNYVAGEYKTGGLSLLQVLTGVDDLGDMLNRLFYYGKVSDKQAQTIQEVKELKQELTDKQAEQEKNVAATQKKVDELNAQQAGIGPNSFDCSGFVSYCLTGRYCRLGTTGTFMGWTRVSDPQPGDVVVNSYHTGIYIGNGQMIHASDYNTGVIISSVAAGMNNNYIFVRY